MTTEKTIRVAISRDQLVADQVKGKTQYAQVGGRILQALRAKGVPIIGVLGVFGVEYGRLIMYLDEGLDGEDLVFEWTGIPLDADTRQKRITFSERLPDRLRPGYVDDDEM